MPGVTSLEMAVLYTIIPATWLFNGLASAVRTRETRVCNNPLFLLANSKIASLWTAIPVPSVLSDNFCCAVATLPNKEKENNKVKYLLVIINLSSSILHKKRKE